MLDKNLDVITYAVPLIIKAAIMASRFSGRDEFSYTKVQDVVTNSRGD